MYLNLFTPLLAGQSALPIAFLAAFLLPCADMKRRPQITASPAVMKLFIKDAFCCALCTAIFIFLASSSSLAAEKLEFTVEEAVDMALERNLSLKIERYFVPVSEADLLAEKGAFDPTFVLNLSKSSAETQSPTLLTATEEDRLTGDLMLGGKMSLGTKYELRWMQERTKSNSVFLLVDPYYRSDLTLTLRQPLLKGLGSRVQESGIAIARNNLVASRLREDAAAMDVVSGTVEAYWELYFSRADLEVSEFSLELARRTLEEVRARIEAGSLPPVEIHKAEAEVAQRQADLIQARKLVADREDLLLESMNLEEWDAEISTLSSPPEPEEPLALEAAVSAALANRRDYRQGALALENARIERDFQANQKLPELDIFGTTGFDGTDREYGRAVEEMFAGDFFKWEVGVTFRMPLPNRQARGRHLRAAREAERAETAVARLRQSIRVEVREAWREARRSIETIRANERVRVASERRLEAENERFRAGKATLKDVLDFQEDYIRALSAERRARVDYAIARVRLERVQGTLAESVLA
jgi:outer membrane protein TolC